MEFLIHCECGKFFTVTEGLAGTSLSCGCGRSIRVPGLSELRAQQGMPAYARIDAEPPYWNDHVRGWLIAGGAALLAGGFFLVLGNRSGAFPTFPFAGGITMAIGGSLLAAGIRG